MGFRITVFVVLDIYEKLASTALFKKTHERRFECLHISCGHLVDLL
jgi:hypothetical protein